MKATIPKHTFRQRLVLCVCALLALAALPVLTQTALAQTAPASASTTVITVPPRPMTAVQGTVTNAADATLWSNGIPGPQSSSVTLPIATSGTGIGGGGGGGGGYACTIGQTQACASNACPSGYTGSVPTSRTCVSPGTWPASCTPTVAMIDAAPTSYGCTPATTCTPSTTQNTQTANCPAGDTVGGAAGGATSFTQTRQVTTSCPNGSNGAAVTSATAWSPSVATECLPAGSGGSIGQTCSVSCPVYCTISVGGFQRIATQRWAGGGGASCPTAGTATGQFNSNYTAGSTIPACRGDQTYTYTTTGSCPTSSGGGTGSSCTLAQVNSGTCATCSRTCGSSESGFACRTRNINATTCSYWSYSGSSCAADGATGGAWRAGLCP